MKKDCYTDYLLVSAPALQARYLRRHFQLPACHRGSWSMYPRMAGRRIFFRNGTRKAQDGPVATGGCPTSPGWEREVSVQAASPGPDSDKSPRICDCPFGSGKIVPTAPRSQKSRIGPHKIVLQNYGIF